MAPDISPVRRGSDAVVPPIPAGAAATGENPYLELAEWLARWMDRRYLDPILGLLLPGAGDTIGAVLGLLGVFAAVKLRAHPLVIARMLLNLSVDALLGSIPLLGPVIDLFYRANTRNLELLRTRDVREPRAADALLVGGAALLFIVALFLPLVLLVWLVALWSG
jgi:hypothetical protein